MSFSHTRTAGKAPKKPPQQQQRGGGTRHKNKAPTTESTAKAYRDRAAERREGGAGDYAESEQLLSHLDNDDKKAEYEQSKYLGGDVAHTHLVKGLDFLLLEKLRGTSAGDSHWDNEVERILSTSDVAAGKDMPHVLEETAATPTGERVMESVLRICQARHEKRNSAVAVNDLFMPGRMCFEITVAPGGAVRATTRIRSQDEVTAIAGHSAHQQGSDRVVLTKVIAAIAAGRHRRSETRYLQKQYTDKPLVEDDAPVAVVDNADVVDGAVEEDDIFADAGVEYQVDMDDKYEDEAVTAPYPEVENDAVTAPYPDSDDGDEGVTAPCPESDDDGEEVTAPYPESEKDDVVLPAANSDNEIDDAALFSMARSRFKEEKSELLSRHQPDSTQSAQSAKRKAATLQSNEWSKTQRILETKYQQK
ncbi:hypothetical protein GGI24_000381 [Coemansia furcata]|nr:hypothetical protein GGI24_000381 [Coemansia furcata]